MKLTAESLKQLKTIRPDVAQHVDDLKKQLRLRNVSHYIRPAGGTYYMAEGAKIRFFAPNGKTLDANMVTESGFCAPTGNGLSHKIGDTPPLPEGTWIVDHELFLGKWVLSVIYVGVSQLPVGA